MLKITRISGKGRVPVIKLEGELVGPWVDMLRQAYQQPARHSRPLRLDLAAVTYVDPAGALLLRDLVSDGVEIAACSNFVAELLVARGS